MRRLLPRSLAGQMALLLGLALLVAQAANFALILNDRQKLSLAQNRAPALARFADAAAGYESAAAEFKPAVLEDNQRRGLRFTGSGSSGIAPGERDPTLETAATAALKAAGSRAAAVEATTGAGSGERARSSPRRDMELLRIAVRQADGSWLRARLYTPRRDPLLALRLGAATLLLYLLVLGSTILIAIRIARPLQHLATAASRFAGRGEPEPVAERGPADVRRAIAAFNAMSVRLTGLLDQKDHMLGAIGHDLRTPLASLRIRIEGLEPPEERAAAIEKIEEMVAMLDDILILARSGRLRDPRPTDLGSLVEAVCDDYHELGRPVAFVEGASVRALVQPDLLRRALRNLIDNAVNYGGSAEVRVERDGKRANIRVSDQGPGIAEADRAAALQPFHRLEQSRNRATGGAGLGLAIASSIAEAHGGTLRLDANQPSGLIATLSIPLEIG